MEKLSGSDLHKRTAVLCSRFNVRGFSPLMRRIYHGLLSLAHSFHSFEPKSWGSGLDLSVFNIQAIKLAVILFNILCSMFKVQG